MLANDAPKVTGLLKPTGCVQPDFGVFLQGCDRRPVSSRVSPFPPLAFVISPFPALRGLCGMGPFSAFASPDANPLAANARKWRRLA